MRYGYYRFLWLILIMLIPGCSGVNRYVQDNVFHSSLYPKTAIKVSDSYKYLGNKKDRYLGSYREDLPVALPSVTTDSYTFGRKEDGTASFIQIEIKKFDPGVITAIIPPFESNSPKNTLEAGKDSQGQDMYYFIFTESSTIAANKTPSCFLIKSMGRNIGRTVQFTINTIEDITNFRNGAYNCNAWNDSTKLDPDQKEHLKAFIKRSQEEISFPEG